MNMFDIEKKRFLHSLVFPFFFLAVIWGVNLTEYFLDANFSHFGVYPQQLKGLPGIFLSPLIHGDFNHLISNSIPWLTLGIGVFYFYNKIAYKIFFLIYFITGFWVWIGAREAYHIGASGIIYGFAAFLFTSGIIRNDIRMLAIALIVVFLYGSMVWGIFPIDMKISWESHLMGSIAGVILAVIYKNEGPQKIKYSWEEDDEDEDEYNGNNLPEDNEDLEIPTEQQSNTNKKNNYINYIYIEKNTNSNKQND